MIAAVRREATGEESTRVPEADAVRSIVQRRRSSVLLGSAQSWASW